MARAGRLWSDIFSLWIARTNRELASQLVHVRCICFVCFALFCFVLFYFVLFCFVFPLFAPFMLVSWGGCDKIHLVVIARIKTLRSHEEGVYILVNSLTLETSIRWFSGNVRACAFPRLVYVRICLILTVSSACSCALNFTAYSLGLLLVTAARVTIVPFSEHLTSLHCFSFFLSFFFFGMCSFPSFRRLLFRNGCSIL